MLIYHFVLRNDVTNEDLGYLGMADDDEALELGKRIVLELVEDHEAEYANSALYITEDLRAVANFPLDSAQRKKFG